MLANSSTFLEQKFHRHFLSNSAASQSLASNPMLAVLLEDEILDFPRAICEGILREALFDKKEVLQKRK